MLNTVYRLVAPRRFEVEFSEIEVGPDTLLVRPTHLSICNADQRYYQGKRAAEVLDEKLPMALIHEGIGEVVFDARKEYQPGELVVMIPNTPTEEDPVIGENYLRSSRFRGSGFDGFMQDQVSLGRDRVVRLPKEMNRSVAAFTEIITVSYHAISRMNRVAHKHREKIAVWGDGNLGYITALLWKTRFPETKLYVLGLNMDKLSEFTFADEVYSVKELPTDFEVDHCFECVGNVGSQTAINQMIDCIRPEGTISILGVSENPPSINTRMMLEKGLHMFGSSRSGRQDFLETVQLFQDHPEVLNYFEHLVGAQIPITSIQDMTRAFEVDLQKAFGKTIMIWEK